MLIKFSPKIRREDTAYEVLGDDEVLIITKLMLLDGVSQCGLYSSDTEYGTVLRHSRT
jgi:hypothetical protein